ncbi:MAG TPA: hypothetical protein VGO88_02330 [Mycetocola sp.]|uniref:hypothetical protein n=1 Tax=Mycetocola sp. TaxID=1871042 RepID=UPI002622026E|nr:hypothetical protein [Mycetocola sp.]HEV7848146.1 hypothetical protein [Mycetocola sp.]
MWTPSGTLVSVQVVVVSSVVVVDPQATVTLPSVVLVTTYPEGLMLPAEAVQVTATSRVPAAGTSAVTFVGARRVPVWALVLEAPVDFQ